MKDLAHRRPVTGPRRRAAWLGIAAAAASWPRQSLLMLVIGRHRQDRFRPRHHPSWSTTGPASTSRPCRSPSASGKASTSSTGSPSISCSRRITRRRSRCWQPTRATSASTARSMSVFARAAGIPIVSIANYTQDNNWGLIANPGTTINLSSLRGESIGVFTDSWTKAMMPYVLQAGNVSASDVKQIIFTRTTTSARCSPARSMSPPTPRTSRSHGWSPPPGRSRRSCWPPSSARRTCRSGSLSPPIRGYPPTPRRRAPSWRQPRQALAWSIAHPQAAVKDFQAAYPNNGSSGNYNLDGWLATIPTLNDNFGLLTQRASEWTETASALKSVNLLSTSFPASSYYTNEYLGG